MKQPEDNIDFLLEQKIAKNTILKYWQPFFKIFSELNDNDKITFDSIQEMFSVKAVTVSKKLKDYLRFYPEHIERIIGFYPSVDTIIDLAESRTGELTKNNIFEINMSCKDIVDSITWPKHDYFIRENMESIGTIEGSLVKVNYDDLAKFMYEDYSDFLTGTDNGRVSIAGRLNEEILLRALSKAGLEKGKDFSRTGSDSVGDIQFHHKSTKYINLYCEVKSYKARERFLRGLRDIPYAEKIGVGFFLDASEFNPKRTKTLLSANPLAIYLPDSTYSKLHNDSKSYKTTEQLYVYRKLSEFVDDMASFVKYGNLPANN